MTLQRLALCWLAALAPACSSSGAGDAGPTDLRAAAERRREAGGEPADGPTADGPTADGRRLEGGAADQQPCQPPQPAKANSVDTCKLSHRPSDPGHLSTKTPAATEAVTVRLETQAGDVQKVTLRLWTGVMRELPMTLESSAGGVDHYRAVVPPSARPSYYRFRLEDGAAVVQLTRGGPQATASGADDFWIAPSATGKTVHYATDFAQPELRWRTSPSGAYQSLTMSAELAGRAGATGLGAAGSELFFFVRDGKTGSEDHPPGGGDYRLAPDLDEAWLDQGALFDVDPVTVTLDLLDCHTHPFSNASGTFTYDPQPLITQLPGQGIGRALTMTTGSPSTQLAQLAALHQAQRWLTPLVWVDPQAHTVAEVEDLLANHGFRGLKFHPVVTPYPADGAAMDPFLDLAAKHRVPVQIHSATDDYAKPWRVVALAKRHPSVPVVMIHTELGALDKTAALAVIKPQPNVYAETSWTNPESILQAMATLDSSRTLFGTDSTVDGYQQFTKQSIANPQGQYVYTLPAVIAAVKAQASAGAYANWARLTAIRLYSVRFRPDADLLDTDGDGLPDQGDPDPDNDGEVGAADPAPLDPSR